MRMSTRDRATPSGAIVQVLVRTAEADRKRLFAAIQHSAESVVITNLAAEIEYVNPAFEQATGCSGSPPSPGATAIAEGVESQEELAMLRELGVQLVQGYLLARPAPVAEWMLPDEPRLGKPRSGRSA